MAAAAESAERIEAKLRLTLGYLSAAAPSPRTREYRTRADSYRRVIDGWVTRVPTEDQRAALSDLVNELHENVLGSARNGSLRAQAK